MDSFDVVRHALLIIKQLHLTLQTTTIILTRPLEIVVHLLDIGHQVGKMRALDRKSLVLLDKAELDTL